MAVILTPIGENTDKKYTDVERELIYTVRTLLKDLPDDVYRSLSTLVEDQRGERWSDAQIYTYLCQSLAKINSAPPLTTATLDSYPTPWTACITTGAVCYALLGEAIVQAGWTLLASLKNLLN